METLKHPPTPKPTPERPTGPAPSNTRVREMLGWNLLPNNRK